MKPDEVVRAFLTDSTWGALEEIHALPGKPYARFCLMERGGLYLEVTEQRVQRCTALTDSTPVRCQLSALRGHIQLPHRRFDLRPAKAKAIVGALGLARLRARITARLPDACGDGPFWHTPGPLLELLLAERSGADEPSLACVRTGATLAGDSSSCGRFTAPAWLWVTDRRLELVACSPAGDLVAEPLDPALLRFSAKGEVKSARRRWSQPVEPLQQLLPALKNLEGSARTLEVVRLAHRLAKPASRSPSAPLLRWSLSLLDPLANQPSTRSAASLLAASLRCGERAAPRASAPALPDSAWQLDLLALHSSWALPPSAGWCWLTNLPQPNAEQATRGLRLARRCWQLARDAATEPVARARADADLAEALLRLGRTQEATGHVERSQRELPALELGDVELGPGRSSPWAAPRRRLAHVRLQAATPQQRAQALLEAWSLDPFNLALLEQLSAASSSRLAQRAKLALATLTEAPPEPTARSVRVVRSLPESLLSVHLQHPFARQQAPLNARLQQLVAAEDHPELDDLRLYCQRITRSDSLVTCTVDELATLFGLGHIDCYVSRGYEDVGVRAYPEQPAYLLLGGQHLDPQSRHHLPPAELAFAVGAELLHVRFKQRRVSTRDVYRGALDKGRRGIDLALSLIPVISTIHLGKRLTMVTAKLSLPQLRRAIHAAKGVSEVVERSATPGKPRRLDLSPATEELLAFQWLQQLNADRAGLLCAGSLTAAVRALLRSRAELTRAASSFEQRGALAALERHRESNPEAFDDLRARLGLMLTFYVSEAFETLSDLAFVPAEPATTPPLSSLLVESQRPEVDPP